MLKKNKASNLALFFFIISWGLNSFSKNNNNIKSDLKTVYATAKEQDQQLQAAISQYNSVLMNFPISISELLPQINLDAQWSKTRTVTGNGAIGGDSESPNNNSQIGFNGTQPIFNTSRTTIAKTKSNSISLNQVILDVENIINVYQAKNQIKQAIYNLESARQDLIIRVIQNYFSIKSEEQNLILLKAEEKAVFEQLKQAKARFEVGVIAKTDVDTAQARYDSIVTEKISAVNKIANDKDKLSIITNEKTNNLADLKNEKLKLFYPQNSNKWVEISKKNNPNLFSAKYEKKIKSQDVQKEFSGHLPTINYSLEKDRSKTTQEIKFIPDISILNKNLSNTIELQLPIFQGGNVYFNTKKADFDYKASKNNYELNLRNTIANTKISFREALTKFKEIQSQKVAVSSAESSLKSTQAGYDVGTRNIVNLLDSISELYRQKRILATNRYEYLVNYVLLKQWSGTLSDNDVYEINNLLEY